MPNWRRFFNPESQMGFEKFDDKPVESEKTDASSPYLDPTVAPKDRLKQKADQFWMRDRLPARLAYDHELLETDVIDEMHLKLEKKFEETTVDFNDGSERKQRRVAREVKKTFRGHNAKSKPADHQPEKLRG